MGAPTSNRKRGSGHLSIPRYSSSPSSYFDSQDYFSSSKKPKLSPPSMHLDSPKRPQSSFSTQIQSIYSRVRQYPDFKPLEREIHGPCRRNFKSPLTMGNSLRQLREAKNAAFDTFKFTKKETEVIHLEEEFPKEDDSSEVEEIQVLNDKSHGAVQFVKNEKGVDHSIDELKEKYKSFEDNQRQGSSSGISDLSNQTPRADDGGKMVGFTREIGKPSEPPHRRLYEESERRNSKLDDLAFQISFLGKKLVRFSTAEKKPEKDLLSELFVKLTDDEEKEVIQALSASNRRKILVTHADSNIEITGQVLQCLRPGAWLNDEVINLYLELLKEREKREPQKFLKCHFFSTFFYKKLISGKGGYDFKAVRRWTTQRKIGYGLIECDKIFVPIHKEIHWCLAIINRKDQKFQYLDSLKGRDSKVLDILARYYVDEVKDKSAKDIDVSSWKQEYVDDLPEQENGFDCGMFMIKYADFYSRGLGLCFSQENMPYFRRRTVKEILKLKAE